MGGPNTIDLGMYGSTCCKTYTPSSLCTVTLLLLIHPKTSLFSSFFYVSSALSSSLSSSVLLLSPPHTLSLISCISSSLSLHSIEDPFETWYDVAHVIKSFQMTFIRKEFLRAHTLVTRCLSSSIDATTPHSPLPWRPTGPSWCGSHHQARAAPDTLV
jgi:hypothetical protein